MCERNPDKLPKTRKGTSELSSSQFAKALTDGIFFVIAIASGLAALSLYINDVGQNFYSTINPDTSDATLYPNSFEMQYVLPDKDRRGANNTDILYNVAIDMHSKSFSAHVPIKTHAEIRFDKSSIPEYYAIPSNMYVVFSGSHNIPSQNTGLGVGYYSGYVMAAKSSEDASAIHYEGTNITQYEMSGQFPIYLSSAKPAIDVYDPSLNEKWPTVNIASEEATNAFIQSEDAKRNQSRQDMATLAIVSVSFIAAIPAANEVIDRFSNPRKQPINKDDNRNGNGRKSSDDH